MNGEKPIVTSLVGASAAPSHAPAARPHITPSWCSERGARGGEDEEFMKSLDDDQQDDTDDKHKDGHPKMHVGADGREEGFFHSARVGLKRVVVENSVVPLAGERGQG